MLADNVFGRTAGRPEIAVRHVTEFQIRIEFPDPVRRDLSHVAESFLALAQRILGPLALGDVGLDADDATLWGRRLATLEDAVTVNRMVNGGSGLAKLRKTLSEAQWLAWEGTMRYAEAEPRVHLA